MTKTTRMVTLITELLVLVFSSFTFASYVKLEDFGENPGNLTASFVSSSAPHKPLVVFLHGCGQNGELVSRQSGFLALAKQHDFNLLLPQQHFDNHSKLCFNWYLKSDFSKGKGESLSLVNMIIATQKITQAKDIFIAGLSAGGAMANIMLINSPQLFLGGAIIAGIPFPCAEDLQTALLCMKQGNSHHGKNIASYNDNISNNHQALPRVSIWTGKQDKIVHHVNAMQIAKQWLKFHQIALPSHINEKEGWKHTRWQDNNKAVKVELIEIENLDHGLPVNSTTQGGGTPAPYLPEAPVSAAVEIIKFWQITN